MAGESDNRVDGVKLVTQPAADRLNPRQLVDYRQERRDCIEWLLAVGKNPSNAEGYARGTVDPRSSRMDIFYRWVWDREGGYTTQVTPAHADVWMQALARDDETSNAHKDACQKAAQMLLKWRHHRRGGEDWEPSIRFSTGPGD